MQTPSLTESFDTFNSTSKNQASADQNRYMGEVKDMKQNIIAIESEKENVNILG